MPVVCGLSWFGQQSMHFCVADRGFEKGSRIIISIHPLEIFFARRSIYFVINKSSAARLYNRIQRCSCAPTFALQLLPTISDYF